MRKNKRTLLSILVFQAAIAICFIAPSARAERATHIIINEIQIAGANSNDEFIELYNPTDISIPLDGYKLSKKTKPGTESTLLSSTTSTKFLGTIPAHGYFLIAHSSFKDKISADLGYSPSYSIASDNTVLLYDKNSMLLDKVGFGLATDSENTPAINPSVSNSLERSNFADTNNNSVDFSMNTSPSPRNSTYFEPAIEPDPDPKPNIDPEEPKCATTSTNIKLNEIFPYPASGDEFVEITNIGDSCVDVSGWKIMDGAGHQKNFSENSTLDPGKYLFLEGNLYLNNDSDTVYILDKNGNSEIEALDSRFYEKVQKDFSYALVSQNWQWTSTPTPGKENIATTSNSNKDDSPATGTDTSATENFSSTENIFLNEILPNPKDGSEGEYIEISNNGSEPVDLSGWRLKDASKSKGYQFAGPILLDPGEYLALYRSDSKIALNNSDESVYLYNPKNEIASSVSWSKSIKNSSYNFDGKSWKWSKYLTPGKSNKFDSEPSVKITKPKNVYKDLFTKFSAKGKDKETKKLKYAWDFGDGKKSTLRRATHKYLDTGKYTVTLAVSDDSQTIEKSFAINVKKYPQPNIEITKIVPNPAGSDTEAEMVDVKNNSNKKIDLNGWKIATGSDAKIYNHPISGEINIDPNETKTITREFSKFSLNNKSGRVQLACPDGKIIDEVEYQKDKIAEGEAYAKIDGEWQWIAPNTQTEIADENVEDNSTAEEPSDEVNEEDTTDGEVLGAADQNETATANYDPVFSSEDAYVFLSRIYFNNSPAPANYCSANNAFSNIAYLLASTI